MRACGREWQIWTRLGLTIATVARTFMIIQIDVPAVENVLSVRSNSGSKACPVSTSFSLVGSEVEVDECLQLIFSRSKVVSRN